MSHHAMRKPTPRPPSESRPAGRHVALLALPDAVVSTLAGLYDVMNAPALVKQANAQTGPPFHIEIVGEAVGPIELASGVPMQVQRAVDTVESTDIVIVPSVLLHGSGWE